MEGRGCRREVPGLTLEVTFGPEESFLLPRRCNARRRAGGPAREGQRGLGGARRQGGLGARPIHQGLQGEHVALSAPAPPPPPAPSERTGANENNRVPPPPGRTRPEMAPRPIGIMDATPTNTSLFPPGLRCLLPLPRGRSREALGEGATSLNQDWLVLGHPRQRGGPSSPEHSSRSRWRWGCPWGDPIHPGGDLSWKNCWVTRVAVCRRLALPLWAWGRACSQLWAPGAPVASRPKPRHSRPEGGCWWGSSCHL